MNTIKNLLEDLKEMSEGNIKDDPLGLSEMTAKECVLCNQKDNQWDIEETADGYVHRNCLDENIADNEERSEENNEKLEI